MRTAGVIGGLGPETTAKFYLRVLEKTQKSNKIHRPPILIWNVPMNFSLERDIIKEGLNKKEFGTFLVEAAKNLEKGGADFIVIPCNTAHLFIEEMRKKVNIPVVSIVEETAQALSEEKIETTSILASQLSMNQRLYDSILKKRKIYQIKPSEEEQRRIGETIDKTVKNEHTCKEKNKIKKIINNLKDRGANSVLLACTDLQLLVNEKEIPLRVFDTMDLLVNTTVRELLKEETR